MEDSSSDDDVDGRTDAARPARVSMMLAEPQVGAVLDLGAEFAKYGEWRAVPGFDALKLRVSSGGWVQVYTKGWDAVYRGSRTQDRHNITANLRTYRVYQLICRAFHGPQPSPAHTVDHLNRNPADNRAENLWWATKAEQIRNREKGRLHSDAKPIFVQAVDSSDPPQWFESKAAACAALGLNWGNLGSVANQKHRNVTTGGYRAWWALPPETQGNLLAGDDSNLLSLPVPGGTPEFPETGPSTEYEVWKQVSSRLWVSTRGRIQCKDKRGDGWGYKRTPVPSNGMMYARVLCNGRTTSVHSLVYAAFGGAVPDNMTVDHKASDRKFDNRFCNLRAATWPQQRRNQIRKPRAEQQASRKKGVLARAKGNPIGEWEYFLGLSYAAHVLSERKVPHGRFHFAAISRVAHGTQLQHKGWVFKFADE